MDFKLNLISFIFTSAIGVVSLNTNAQFDDYPFYAESIVQNTTPSESKIVENQVQILHSGIASFQKRIDLVRKAKKSISMEYFIWEKDTSGLLLIHELIKKAKEGVKVRIILDKSIVFIELNEFYAEALAKYGIELRHYHRALDPYSAQFRTHRKITVIDGQEAITGGRNIGDDYFDLDEEYSFLDRDIYVQGSIAKAIEDSFEHFWKSSIVKKSKVLKVNPRNSRLFRNRRDRDRYNNIRDEKLEEQREEARKWVDSHQSMAAIGQRVESIARPILNSYPYAVCPKLSFASDRPVQRIAAGIDRDYVADYRSFRKVMFHHIENDTRFNEEFIMASPYFILNKQWQKSLSYVIGTKKVKASLYTNSLGSTDAFHVSANFYHIAFDWQNFGLEPYIHNSLYSGYFPVFNEKVEKARWGMHEKNQIYNNDTFMIGTYNIDNRSDFFNVEMGVFCAGSKVLTDNLKDDFKLRRENYYLINGKDKAIDYLGQEADVYGNASQKQINIMKGVTLPSILFKPLM